MEPDGTLVVTAEVTAVVVLAPVGAAYVSEGGAKELDTALEALDGADETLDGRETASVVVGFSAVMAVVGSD